MNNCRPKEVEERMTYKYQDLGKEKKNTIPLRPEETKAYRQEIELAIFRVLGATCMGWIVWDTVIPMAYAERGYHAYGGEWILVGLGMWLGWWSVEKLWNV